MTTATANIFEQASRQALRFNTANGNLSVEELWTVPLTARSGRISLDAIAIDLNEQLEKASGKSFVSSAKKDDVLQLRFDIVKHMIDTLVAEKDAKTEEVKRKSQLGKIDDLIAKKKDSALADLSLEELEAMRAKV